MMKTKIALAVMLTAFALAPASAAKTKKKKATASASSTAKKSKNDAPVAPERRQDKAFDALSVQFLNAMWRMYPESAIGAGKFDTAANLTIPNNETRAKSVAFSDEWLAKFKAINGAELSTRQRTDLALVINELESNRWYTTTFKAWEWNPARYSIAGALDALIKTDYAAKPQRLRTILKRLENVPAYYQAAQDSINNPTHEHTQLAIRQAPGNIKVLDDVAKAASEEAALTEQEKALFTERVAAAKRAIDGYVAFLTALDAKQMADNSARSFRIGKELYAQKFALDIQSGSTAEQTYQKALAAKEELLSRMDKISDELWPRVMGSTPKPSDRFDKIGAVIDKLSANHVKREDFFAEIRRQIPMLQDWVTQHKLLTLDPKKPLVVRETPEYMRGVAGASISAPGPYRPMDRTYYNVTPFDTATPEQAESTLREYNDWILQILNIHEAIPGHYAQLVYANKSPSIIKSLFGSGSMVEGWAVYGERMMLEAGYGNNAPEMWLMWSKWNLRSVTNTILDYEIHNKNLDKEGAIRLLRHEAFQTEREANEKWFRAQVSQVQLTSYFSGYSEIMELREARKQALGAKFDVRAFNEQFLSYGSAPVKVIRELMQ